MQTFQSFIEDHKLIEGLLHSLGRSINNFNVRAYQTAVEDYKKKVNSGEKASHGVLVRKLASTYNIEARALDEILTRMIKANQIKKAHHMYVTNDSDPEMIEK